MPPLGAWPRNGGVDVAVFSANAEEIEFCVFDPQDCEIARHPLGRRLGDVHFDFIPGVATGARYGLRAHGAFEPWRGHRFNAAKLLLDPYATRIDRPFKLDAAMFDTGEAPSGSDSAAFMPKAIVSAPPVAAPVPPACDWQDLIIYEMHVKGFSKRNEAVPEGLRGTFGGLAHPASIEYLRALGITAVEVLPCAAWLDERHLPPLGLNNYWGYNPVGYCAPDPRLAPGGFAEIRDAVTALREAGIATILDVVYNHSAESDEFGPTVSVRGLDNAAYYRLLPDDPRRYVDDAGCGNILACERPAVVRLITDSLRLWASATGADGFRFDLAPVLGRNAAGFDAAAPLLTAIAQDPVLRERVLIAEPWDIGAGGYRLGDFGAPWAEWNDKFRDTARRFWRGDKGMRGDMATRLAGSADIFARSRRPPSRGVNFVTAHDGFTLRDLLSYADKHNEANGEQNRDGTGNNYSWNHGVEGPSDDAGIAAARACDARALLATLLFSRGTPMLSMGDESGHTQRGNNNAYAQDCDLSWLDWAGMDQELIAATQRMIALRRTVPALTCDVWLTGKSDQEGALPDVAWLRPDGAPMAVGDWENPDGATLIAVLNAPAGRAMLVLHAGWQAETLTLPPPLAAHRWELTFDSADLARQADDVETATAAPRSVLLLLETPRGPRATGASDQTVRALATKAGLAPFWWDVEGVRHIVSPGTLRALLASLRLPTGSETEARASLQCLA
ncbi:MAG TPA: glycogen debranching protein GlgX, partial [Acetobacteraceae bacterium]|nr:glycogen debranching protein GlgX [Acetobacteraceae bacterium]